MLEIVRVIIIVMMEANKNVNVIENEIAVVTKYLSYRAAQLSFISTSVKGDLVLKFPGWMVGA